MYSPYSRFVSRRINRPAVNKRRPQMRPSSVGLYVRKAGLYVHLLQECNAGVDVLVHDLIDIYEVYDLAVVGYEIFHEWAALERTAEFECLCCVEEFDCQYAFYVFHNLVAFGGCVGAHGNEVFLVLAGRNAVNGGWCAELFGLADDGSCCVLRNHETAVEAWFCYEEAREIAFAVDELIGAAFADAAEFCGSDCEEIEYHGKGFAVEVAAGDYLVFIRKHDRIVGGGVDFGLYYAGDVGDGVLGGAVNLRSAAEGIGVLNGFAVLCDDFAAFHIFADVACGFELAFVRTDHVETFIEGVDAAVKGVEAYGEDHVGLLAEALCLEDAPYGVGAHELGAVEEGEAFLALEFDGLPSHFIVNFLDVHALAFVVNVAHAEDGGEHKVGERAEVAAGAEGTLLVNDWEDVVVVAINETLCGLELYAAIAEAEVLDLEQEHELYDFLWNFVADAAGVAHDEVLLELAELVFADGDVAEGAEAGGYTVDGHFLGFHFLVQVIAAFLDSCLCVIAEGDGHFLGDDFAYSFKSESF